MVCERCNKRGKTWQGADPKCAFLKGPFGTDNWNCATASCIRTIAEVLTKHEFVHLQYLDSDERFATIVVEHIKGLGGAMTLYVNWYKNRGKTTGMWLMFDGGNPRPPTEAECNLIIQAYDQLLMEIAPHAMGEVKRQMQKLKQNAVLGGRPVASSLLYDSTAHALLTESCRAAKHQIVEPPLRLEHKS